MHARSVFIKSYMWCVELCLLRFFFLRLHASEFSMVPFSHELGTSAWLYAGYLHRDMLRRVCGGVLRIVSCIADLCRTCSLLVKNVDRIPLIGIIMSIVGAAMPWVHGRRYAFRMLLSHCVVCVFVM